MFNISSNLCFYFYFFPLFAALALKTFSTPCSQAAPVNSCHIMTEALHFDYPLGTPNTSKKKRWGTKENL